MTGRSPPEPISNPTRSAPVPAGTTESRVQNPLFVAIARSEFNIGVIGTLDSNI
jgi:hypothetical protein